MGYGLHLVAQNDGASTEYFGYDGLGSVRQVMSSAGEVLFAQVFDPYGNPYASVGTDSTSWGFTGEQTDENGLVFLRARYYNPSHGRFLQPDHLWGNDYYPRSINKWLYVYNNPTRYVDPSGNWFCTVESSLFNPNCVEWVEDALAQLESGTIIGPRIAKFFYQRDNDLIRRLIGRCSPFAGNPSGIRIAFIPLRAAGMAIAPNTIIMNSLIYNGSSASVEAMITFAHEISHLEQGLIKSVSIQGEILSAILSYQLEEEYNIIEERRHPEGVYVFDNRLNPWDYSDLATFKSHPDWKVYYSLHPLRPWDGDFSRDWLSKWGTNFPYPVPRPPQGTPTPPPAPTPIPAPPTPVPPITPVP